MSLETALVIKEPECSEADHDYGHIKEASIEQQQIFMEQMVPVQPVSVKQEPVCVKQEPIWDTASSSTEYDDDYKYEVELEPTVLPIETFDDETSLSLEPLEGLTAHEAVEATGQVPPNAYSVQHTGGINIYVCYTCGKICKEENSIIQHIMVSRHLPAQNTESKRHKKHVNREPEKPYTCAKCKEEFTTSFRFQQHQLLHFGNTLFTCDVCHYKFTQASELKRHKRVHTLDKPYSCVLDDTGKKPYACKECDETFSKPNILKRHILAHSRTKVYSCEICEAKFLMSSPKLKQTGEKPFACKVCDQKFSQEGNFKRYRTRGSRNSWN